MEELIKYFQSLEARLTAQEERLAAQSVLIATLEAKVEELQKRPAPQPEVVEKVVEKIVEKPVEVIKEVVVEKPVAVATPQPVVEPVEVKEPVVAPEPIAAPEPEPVKEEPVKEEPIKEEPVVEEVASPKAAVYGKAVSDIRQAISLGDRFLYQRELFGQNAELMQRTLTELNGLGSFDEAMSYIAQFGWDTESNTYQQFIVTLHRRFG